VSTAETAKDFWDNRKDTAMLAMTTSSCTARRMADHRDLFDTPCLLPYLASQRLYSPWEGGAEKHCLAVGANVVHDAHNLMMDTIMCTTKTTISESGEADNCNG
jgi:hypothetical protein